MAVINNSIVINCDFDSVFEQTNDIENWANLFTEYKESAVLEKRPNYVKFRLETFPNESGKVYSWISERFIDKENKQIKARRLEPLLPFKYMQIEWFYKELPEGTEMQWVQKFEVDSKSGLSEEKVVAYLNKTSREQMRAIKKNIEAYARGNH